MIDKDIGTSNIIFGPNTPSLKGETFRKSLDKVKTGYVQVPHQLMERNKQFVIVDARMFANRLLFIVIILVKLIFVMTLNVPNRTEGILLNSIKMLTYTLSAIWGSPRF